jgi:anti-sigma factor RsiW
MSEKDSSRDRLAAGEVTCEALFAFLLEYLAGELPAARARAFEEHLALCRSCVAYLETYRTTIALARAAERAPELDPAALPAELVTAILAARE